MTSEEKIIGAVALGGLALWAATRGSAKAHGGTGGPEGSSSPADPCKQLAVFRAQRAALMATGQFQAANGLLPAIAKLEDICEPKSGYEQKMAKFFGDRDDPAICLRWKTADAKVPWGAPQYSKIDDATNDALEQHYTDFGSIAEAEVVAFKVARTALKSVCPRVPVPALLEQVQAYRDDPDLGFWWDNLWDYFYSVAWTRVVEMGGGG